MCKRESPVRTCTGCSRNPRDDFERNSSRLQPRSLFAAASENIRVAALETDYSFTAKAEFNELVVDLSLVQTLSVAVFNAAGSFAFGSCVL